MRENIHILKQLKQRLAETKYLYQERTLAFTHYTETKIRKDPMICYSATGDFIKNVLFFLSFSPFLDID